MLNVPDTGGCRLCRWDGHIKVDAAVWAGGVVVHNVSGQDVFEVAAVADQHPVEAFGAHGAHPPLGIGVCLWRPWRGLDGLDTGRGEYRVEGGGVLGARRLTTCCSWAWGTLRRHGRGTVWDGPPVGGDAGVCI